MLHNHLFMHKRVTRVKSEGSCFLRMPAHGHCRNTPCLHRVDVSKNKGTNLAASAADMSKGTFQANESHGAFSAVSHPVYVEVNRERYIHAYIRTYIHLSMHTYIHTYIHTCLLT